LPEHLSESGSASRHEFVFSWSIAFSVAYPLVIYALRSLVAGSRIGPGDSGTDFSYYYFRAAARLTNALHLMGESPVSTAFLARQEDHWAQLGRELTFLTSALCLMFVFAFILKLIGRTRVYSVMIGLLFVPVTLFAVPAGYVAALSMTRTVPINVPILGETGIPTLLVVLLTEMIIWIAVTRRKNQDSHYSSGCLRPS
jgi:hypothetical protein